MRKKQFFPWKIICTCFAYSAARVVSLSSSSTCLKMLRISAWVRLVSTAAPSMRIDAFPGELWSVIFTSCLASRAVISDFWKEFCKRILSRTCLRSVGDIALKIPRFEKINVNIVNIFYAIVLIKLASCSFQCTLSLYWQSIYLHSVIADQNELKEAKEWQTDWHKTNKPSKKSM